MFKISLVGILTAALSLVMWWAISTGLELIGVWQRNDIDPDWIFETGLWVAGFGGFAAPILLYLLFRALYPPQRPPQPKLPRR